MKTIKLLLLLTLTLFAKEEIIIPETVSCSLLQEIATNGWNDSNETLNLFIISSGEHGSIPNQ